MVRVLILGATGTVGKEVVRALLDKTLSEQQVTIRVVSRNKAKAQETLNPITHSFASQLEYVEGDLENIQNEESTRSIFENVNRIFILTQGGTTQADKEKQILLLAIKYAGVHLEQVVKLSALGANISNPHGCLMRFHAQAEEALSEVVKGTKLAFTILRPNLFLQNLLRDDIHDIKTTGKFYRALIDRPHTKISHVDVRDIGDVAAKVLSAKDIQQHHNLTYNLGAKAVDYYQLAEILSKGIGKKVEFLVINDAELFGAMKQYVPLEMAHFIVKLYQHYRAEGTTAVGYGDIEIVTGKPARTIEQFVQDYKEQFL